MDSSPSVVEYARRAVDAAPLVAAAPPQVIDAALGGIADRLLTAREALAAANEADIRSAEAAGMTEGTLDRLRLGEHRLAAMSEQLQELAKVPGVERSVRRLPLGPDLELEERRTPVGVIGANFEARPNVVVDVASQLLKSGNAGVLRTGSAALRSAAALVDAVVGPALAAEGLPSAAIQLIRTPGRQAARELVSHADLVPLVILRGSGDSTRELAQLASQHGVRTLAHADGGGVVFLDASADWDVVSRVITASLDRLGVCNRLNLLLVAEEIWAETVPRVVPVLEALGITASLPPHDHDLGHEWALDDSRQNTVTVAPVSDARAAARAVNHETSGLAASIIAEDQSAIDEFVVACGATAVLVNATPRLVDGYKLLGVPETGINVDHVPGPRGPVTFQDLCLRQFVVAPPRTFPTFPNS
jgi:glutamate-5-semialdehyde dehydrogenase